MAYGISYLPFKPFTIASPEPHPVEPILIAIVLDQTTMAVAIITLFGLFAIFLYPLLGHWLHLKENWVVWAGTAIQAIPQVVAAGFCLWYASR